jgi:hypothetical protein
MALLAPLHFSLKQIYARADTRTRMYGVWCCEFHFVLVSVFAVCRFEHSFLLRFSKAYVRVSLMVCSSSFEVVRTMKAVPECNASADILLNPCQRSFFRIT